MNDSNPLPAPVASPLASPVTWTRGVAVGSLLGLIVLSLLWELWLAPVKPGGSLLALKALPLTIPLAGLLKNRMYTYRWVSLMVWLYFTEGVVRATSDRSPSSWLAGVEVLLCVCLFTACAMHVRWRLRHPAAAAAAPAVADPAGPAVDPAASNIATESVK
ncbi:hypothetical protein BH09PSE5_BH09PSE5_28980 [soil metagenome]